MTDTELRFIDGNLCVGIQCTAKTYIGGHKEHRSLYSNNTNG